MFSIRLRAMARCATLTVQVISTRWGYCGIGLAGSSAGGSARQKRKKPLPGAPPATTVALPGLLVLGFLYQPVNGDGVNSRLSVAVAKEEDALAIGGKQWRHHPRIRRAVFAHRQFPAGYS
jgi:hypothetical protein